MSRRITSDLINITNGLHHLNGYFSGKKYLYPYGCSRRVIPSSTAPHRYECKYVKQDFYEGHTTNMIKQTILARMTNGISSNYIASETKTFTVKWFDTVHIDGKQAPARPIQGYYDRPKPQCPPFDPKPCKPSDKKSPACNPCCPANPMARIMTCKPKCDPKKKRDSCGPKEKKKSPCGVRLNTSCIATEAKFDFSCPKQFLLDAHKYLFKTDLPPEILDEICPTLLRSSGKQDVSTQDAYESVFYPAPEKYTCRGDYKRSSSCPASFGGSDRGYYCPSTENCPSEGDRGGGFTCPPLLESFDVGYRCPSRNIDPSQGGEGDGGSCQPLICAKGGCPPPRKSKKKKTVNQVKPRCPSGNSGCAKKTKSCPPPSSGCNPTPKCGSAKVSCRPPKSSGGCVPPKKKDPCGGKGKRSRKGSICPPPKKVPNCPPKGKGRRGKGFSCPKPKKIKNCPPKGKGKGKRGKGPICPPPKKFKGCKGKKHKKSKKPNPCKPKKRC